MWRVHRYRGSTLLELQFAFVLLGVGLTGVVPLLVMQARQIKLVAPPASSGLPIYYTPAANVWSRHLGAAAQSTTSAPTSTSYPTSGYINFQLAQDPSPGTLGGHVYRVDGGLGYGDRGQGYFYGWSGDNTTSARNRNSIKSADERYDTFQYMQQFTWECAVNNGLYSVHLVAGDPTSAEGLMSINIEGLPAISYLPTIANPWAEATVTVLVVDGKLTVSTPTPLAKNKLCYIDYAAATPPNVLDIRSVNFSPTSDTATVTLGIRRP